MTLRSTRAAQTKALADLGRNFQSSKQTWHRMTPDAWA